MDTEQPDIDDVTAAVPPREQVSRLVRDFRVMAQAEIDYYCARLSYSADIAKSASLLVALALFSLFGAVVALILGLLLALAQIVGFLGATLCLSTLFVAVAVILALFARRNMRKLSFSDIDESSNHE
jgi:uncharacterized protein YacL